jgi:hypothetical protein
MKPNLIVGVRDLYGEGTLAGSINGASFFPKMLGATAGVLPDSVVVFDLKRIDLVTASFFRSAFKAYRDHARSATAAYLVIANANAATKEEAAFFAESANDALVFATLTKSGELVSPVVLGKLDEKQEKTLSALVKLKEADAGQLLETYPERPPISSAAWSNRLASLAAKGIVVERLEGRTKKYRPIIEGIVHGH